MGTVFRPSQQLRLYHSKAADHMENKHCFPELSPSSLYWWHVLTVSPDHLLKCEGAGLLLQKKNVYFCSIEFVTCWTLFYKEGKIRMFSIHLLPNDLESLRYYKSCFLLSCWKLAITYIQDECLHLLWYFQKMLFILASLWLLFKEIKMVPSQCGFIFVNVWTVPLGFLTTGQGRDKVSELQESRYQRLMQIPKVDPVNHLIVKIVRWIFFLNFQFTL